MFRIRCAIRPAGALSGWQIHAAQQEIQFGQIGVVQLGAGAAQGGAGQRAAPPQHFLAQGDSPLPLRLVFQQRQEAVEEVMRFGAAAFGTAGPPALSPPLPSPLGVALGFPAGPSPASSDEN